uniref:Cation_ATPase_C domain-containing protein n=1 Tax=Syphacia muris TaxID=451379 RepID=A0A0N5AJ26_9BILA
MARLALSDSVLLVVTLYVKQSNYPAEIRGVFVLIALIGFEGLVFANFTHASEMLVQRHDEGVHLKNLLFAVTIAEIGIKLMLLLTSLLPAFGLKLYSQLTLHFSAPICIVLTVLFNAAVETNGQFITKADPVFTIINSAIIFIVALPALQNSVRIFLYEVPKGFQVDEFKKEINIEFPKATCDHFHVYKKHGSNTFDAFLCITYRCSMDDPQWDRKAQIDITKMQEKIRSLLVKAGGKSITVQPFIVDENNPVAWNHCLNDDCPKKSCCQTLTENNSLP